MQGALLLLSEGFDVLVIDISLPNNQAEALIGAVRAKPRWSSLPIVAVGDTEQREATMAAGADFFIRGRFISRCCSRPSRTC